MYGWGSVAETMYFESGFRKFARENVQCLSLLKGKRESETEHHVVIVLTTTGYKNSRATGSYTLKKPVTYNQQ